MNNLKFRVWDKKAEELLEKYITEQEKQNEI